MNDLNYFVEEFFENESESYNDLIDEFTNNLANRAKLLCEQEHGYISLEDLYLIEQGVVIVTEAKFEFLPKFKYIPELKSSLSTLKEAQDLLNTKDERVNGATIHKMGRIAIRILDIYWNVNDILALPSLILIITIPFYLLDRLISLGFRKIYEESVKDECENTIEALKRAYAKEKNPAMKKIFKEKIDKLEKSYKRLKEASN